MAKLMWQIPASAEFVRSMVPSAPVTFIPPWEHQYLGHQLNTKGSAATQVLLPDNAFASKNPIVLEGRAFYFQYISKSWFVLVDGQ
jgi:hypothetical protein